MKKKASSAASGARCQCQVPGCGLKEASAGLEEEVQRLFWKGQKGSEEVSVAGVVLAQGGW